MGVGSVTFMLLGVAGLVLFGTGLLLSVGGMLARRPVLLLDGEGCGARRAGPCRARRGARCPGTRWPGSRRCGAGWPTRRGEQDYLVFLPDPELAELARTSDRPQLVALTMRDVPSTAAAVPWCFAVEQGWDATLAEIVKEARRRRRVPVIDRRTK